MIVVRTIEEEKRKLDHVPNRLVPQVKKARASGMEEAIRMAKSAEPKPAPKLKPVTAPKTQRAVRKWYQTL